MDGHAAGARWSPGSRAAAVTRSDAQPLDGVAANFNNIVLKSNWTPAGAPSEVA